MKLHYPNNADLGRMSPHSMRVGITPLNRGPSPNERKSISQVVAFFASHDDSAQCLQCGAVSLYQSWDYKRRLLVGACATHKSLLPALKRLA